MDAGASIEPNEKENLLDDLLGGDLPQDALGNNNGDLLDDLLGDLVDLGL